MLSLSPPAAAVRPLVVLATLLTVAAVGGGLALQELAGGGYVESDAPAALAVSIGAFGALIVWVQPWNRIGLLMLGTGVGFGLGVLAAGTLDFGARRGGVPAGLEHAALAWIWVAGTLTISWILIILWFPDATFPSRGWRRYFTVSLAVTAALSISGWLLAPQGVVYDFFAGTDLPAGIHGPLATEALRPYVKLGDLSLLLPLIALAGLGRRYRASTPVVRQQIRWLLVPAAVGIVCQLVGLPLHEASGPLPALGVALSMFGQPLTVVGVAVGVLRYRLWEMEIVVSRALVYAVLWAVLTAVLLVPALAAGLLVGGSGALAAVALALLVTIVFRPAARRLERLAERLVYRHRARPHVLMTSFWDLLRSTVDPAALGPLVAGAVRDGLAVQWAGVWTAGTAGSLRPLGVSGAVAGPPRELPPEAAASLRRSAGTVLAEPSPGALAALWPSPPAAVVPLAGGDELVGVLACGQRRGDELAGADFELLELLGRECALRLRNLGLESQLRERLAQIELQAEELRRSRQRLVTAQDEERRRIERNIHDGVQQQLVALAIRLRRAVDDLGCAAAPLVGDLAVEAEDAVFALQELGRGIFPTVLADRGLAAALRTHAARIPTAVRVDAAPSIAGQRLDPEHEAALYFVALEALANVQKHADGAAADVSLRREGGWAVLEVRDGGPGFDPDGDVAGTGLQNMADRIAAIGGELVVERSPGGGTLVRAAVPQTMQLAVSPTPTPAGR